MLRSLATLIGVGAVLTLLWAMDPEAAVTADEPRRAAEAPELKLAAPILQPTAPKPQRVQTAVEPVPNDPPQSGDCDLVIDFIDSVTSLPVAGEVKLYRLDAPANELWSRGDQLQLKAYAQDGTFTAAQIPPGKYRAYPLFAAVDSSTPPAFEVEGGLTRITQKVEMPRSVQVRLHLFRSDGLTWNGNAEPVQFSLLEPHPAGGSKKKPDWLTYRQIRNPETAYYSEEEYFTMGRVGAWTELPYDANGFQLWEWSEDHREQPLVHRFLIRPNDQSSNKIRLKLGEGDRYAAIYLDPQQVQDALVFPNGVEAIDFRSQFKIQNQALSFGQPDERTLQDAWQELTIRVSLDSADYQPVRLTWKPAQDPLPKIWLTPRHPKD